jgi:hypothetical protein|tara:strand:- start:845 stop:1027 length:183 start_codon:yes stop_codon:yes gene_type:complete
MAKKSKAKWGIWVINQKTWLEDSKRKPVAHVFRREAQKECDELNGMWKGRKKSYEVKKLP